MTTRLTPTEIEEIRKRSIALASLDPTDCTERTYMTALVAAASDAAALLADRDATMEVGTREALVALIMECVRQEPVKSDRKVTIDELEAILNSDDPEQICLAPDGGIMTRPKPLTVGALADKILSRFTLAGAWRPIKRADARNYEWPWDCDYHLIAIANDPVRVLEARWNIPHEGASPERGYWETRSNPGTRGMVILPEHVTHAMPLPAPPSPNRVTVDAP